MLNKHFIDELSRVNNVKFLYQNNSYLFIHP